MKKILTILSLIISVTPVLAAGISEYNKCKMDLNSSMFSKELSPEYQQKLDLFMKTPLKEDHSGQSDGIYYFCSAGTIPDNCAEAGKDSLKTNYTKALKQQEIDDAVIQKCGSLSKNNTSEVKQDSNSVEKNIVSVDKTENKQNILQRTGNTIGGGLKSTGSAIGNVFKSDKKKLAEATEQATDEEKQALSEFNTSVQNAKSEFEETIGKI